MRRARQEPDLYSCYIEVVPVATTPAVCDYAPTGTSPISEDESRE